jgi:hypothetical protein
MKVKGSHDNLTEEMMVEVVKRQHSVRKRAQKHSSILSVVTSLL